MKIKLIYKIILLLFITTAIIIGLIVNFSLSDAVSFYLGISALIIAIISLSIADKKIDKIDYLIKAWWDKKENDWYYVKFKIINNSKTNISNINLLISLPKSTSILNNSVQQTQFEELLADNALILQTDILKFFPTEDFEYIIELKLELPHWKKKDIIFVLSADKYKAKTIKIKSNEIIDIINSNSSDKALTFR